MDPNRPRTPEELALEVEANKQSAELLADENPTESQAEAVDDDQIADADATSGALDSGELFSSLDTGVQASPDAIPDASVEHRSKESAVANAATSADAPASDAAFLPPTIEEIAASFRAAPIADMSAATLARDMMATWQDLPAEFDSHRHEVTENRRAPTDDRAGEGDPQFAPASVDVGAFMATEPAEPPTGANENFNTFDRMPHAPTEYIAVSNFLGRPDDSIVIERGPVRTDDGSFRPSVKLLSETSGDSDSPKRPSDAELSPRATMLQSPTSDGGPPLARPIFLVSVPDEQTRHILDEALAEASRRDAKTAGEVAKQQVDDAFWLRACEERALYRGR